MRHILGIVLLLLFLVAPVRAEMAVTEASVQAQVQGAVKRPGVYRLPSGARVAELLAKAGGPRPDAQLKHLNLAQRLDDGQLVYVPTQKEAAQQAVQARAEAALRRTASRGRVRGAVPRRVNLNTASIQELETLPGVGPGLAAAILRQRKAMGRFRSIEDLREIQGIGKKRFERLRALVTVD